MRASRASDWDSDGDLDLLSGSLSGKVYLSKNEDGALGAFELLFDAALPLSKDVKNDYDRGSIRIWVDDFNNDKKLDLLIGYRVGTVWLYHQK